MTAATVLARDDVAATIVRCLRDIAANHRVELPPEIDQDASFASFGLDSLAMVELVARVGDALEVDLEPELAFNYPTIAAVSAHLAAREES